MNTGDMTVTQYIELTTKLQAQIGEAVKEKVAAFQAETGVSVESVRVDVEREIDGLHIRTTVRLPLIQRAAVNNVIMIPYPTRNMENK